MPCCSPLQGQPRCWRICSMSSWERCTAPVQAACRPPPPRRAAAHACSLPRPCSPQRRTTQEENVSLGPATREGELVWGVAHIFASFNDTFVHVTDLSGKVRRRRGSGLHLLGSSRNARGLLGSSRICRRGGSGGDSGRRAACSWHAGLPAASHAPPHPACRPLLLLLRPAGDAGAHHRRHEGEGGPR